MIFRISHQVALRLTLAAGTALALGVLAAGAERASAESPRSVKSSPHTTAFRPVWTKHPRFVRAGSRVLFAVAPATAESCRISLAGPHRHKPVSWTIRGSRLAALKIKTRRGATRGQWRFRAACTQSSGKVLHATARTRVQGGDGAGEPLARRSDIHIQRSARIPGACPTVQIVGVRGSGQHSGQGHTVGAVVSSFYQEKIAGAQSDAIDYPAVDVRPGPGYNRNYINSVTQGINALYGYIVTFIERCGSTPLLLAGYSQGAEIIDDVLEDLVSEDQREHIAGTVLFGDPRFSPGNIPPIDQGTYDDEKGGISRVQFSPPTGKFGTLVSYNFSYFSTLRSYCSLHDPICNTSSFGQILSCVPPKHDCDHYHYPDRTFDSSKQTYTQAAAAFLVKRFRAFQPPSTPTPPGPEGPDPDPGPGSGPTSKVILAQGPVAPAGYRYAITLSGFRPGSAVPVSCHDSVDPGGFAPFMLPTDSSGNAFTQSYCYSGDGPDHWVIAGGVESNHVVWGGGGITAAAASSDVRRTRDPQPPGQHIYGLSQRIRTGPRDRSWALDRRLVQGV